MKRIATVVVVTLMCVPFAKLPANEPPAPKNSLPGPPPEVVQAWQNGEGHLLPGPPQWVIDRRAEAGQMVRLSGPPPWVISRQQQAAELGLSGPPAEVIESWREGDGFNLPGPPAFILEMFSGRRN